MFEETRAGNEFYPELWQKMRQSRKKTPFLKNDRSKKMEPP